MDIYAAQKVFGRGRTFDRIDLAVAEVTPSPVPGPTRALLGPVDGGPPSSRGQQFEALIGAYSLMMSVSSFFALFVGMFIIYNVFAIAVAERSREIGVLRALGATQARIRRLFLGESAVMGLAGSLIGLGAGVLLSRGIAAASSQLINDVFGVPQPPPEHFAASNGFIGVAIALGVVTSMVAAYFPARQAGRIDPVRALQKGTHQQVSSLRYRQRAVIAAGLSLCSAVCLVGGGGRPIFYLGYALTIVAALVLTPILSLALARVVRPLLAGLSPVEGTLAADSLIQAPRRTSASVSALMLSLALVVTFGGISNSSHASILGWIDATLNADLYVMASPSPVARTLRFPAGMEAQLSGVPGVRRVQPVRQATVNFRGAPVMLLAAPLLSVGETSRAAVVEGAKDEMFGEAAAGRGIIVSESLAQLQGLAYGEIIELATPGGTLRLPIVGRVIDYSGQQGALMIDRTVYQRYWSDDSINFFRLFTAPGADVAAVRRLIIERFSGEHRFFMLDNGQLRDYIVRITSQWFGLTYLQLAVAILVAVLGIVNTLTVSITDRRRELGVLRAVGALQGQVKRTIRIEALAVAGIALCLGFGLGAANLAFALSVVRKDIAGVHLDYRFPAVVAMQVIRVILLAAALAAFWPSRAAVRAPLVEALEYE